MGGGGGERGEREKGQARGERETGEGFGAVGRRRACRSAGRRGRRWRACWPGSWPASAEACRVRVCGGGSRVAGRGTRGPRGQFSGRAVRVSLRDGRPFSATASPRTCRRTAPGASSRGTELPPPPRHSCFHLSLPARLLLFGYTAG